MNENQDLIEKMGLDEYEIKILDEPSSYIEHRIDKLSVIKFIKENFEHETIQLILYSDPDYDWAIMGNLLLEMLKEPSDTDTLNHKYSSLADLASNFIVYYSKQTIQDTLDKKKALNLQLKKEISELETLVLKYKKS